MYVIDLKDPLLLSSINYSLNHANIFNSSTQSSAPIVSNIYNFIYLEKLHFLHTALGGPSIDTLKKAINAGYLKKWPEFKKKYISKLTESDSNIFNYIN